MDGDSSLDFFAAVRLCLRKYADFRGRAARAEFWWWVLFQWLAGSALNMAATTSIGIAEPQAVRGAIAGTTFLTPNYTNICSLTWLVFLLPWLAVTVRRLHDANRSGWCSLLGWAPLLTTVLVVASADLLQFQRTPEVTAINRYIALALAVLGLLLLIGWVRFLIALCKHGTAGENRFGPDPLGASASPN